MRRQAGRQAGAQAGRQVGRRGGRQVRRQAGRQARDYKAAGRRGGWRAGRQGITKQEAACGRQAGACLWHGGAGLGGLEGQEELHALALHHLRLQGAKERQELNSEAMEPQICCPCTLVCWLQGGAMPIQAHLLQQRCRATADACLRLAHRLVRPQRLGRGTMLSCGWKWQGRQGCCGTDPLGSSPCDS